MTKIGVHRPIFLSSVFTQSDNPHIGFPENTVAIHIGRSICNAHCKLVKRAKYMALLKSGISAVSVTFYNHIESLM